MKEVTFKVYEIDEHPNPEKVYEWIRENWHDLNEHNHREIIASLEKLHEVIGGELNYSISDFPDRGEFITLKNYNEKALAFLSLKSDECQLTGTWCDQDVIVAISDNNPQKIINLVHQCAENEYSEQGIKEMCQANNYYFYENGKIYREK